MGSHEPSVTPAEGRSTPSAWNLPNLITVVRIFFAPAVIVCLLVDAGAGEQLRWWACALFVVGMATDGIDGHLARARGLVTDFGKIADPIADKGLVGCALVGMSIVSGSWLLWLTTALILVREIGITVMRMVVIRREVIAASWAGKVKTVSQSVAISVSLAPLWIWIGSAAFVIDGLLLGVALVLTWYSGLQYFVAVIKETRTSHA